jgi:hypothetical protein
VDVRRLREAHRAYQQQADQRQRPRPEWMHGRDSSAWESLGQ